jgi:CheY-like chemotaxis protein
MTLSSMVVSRDWAEVSVLECILGGLHIGVDVEPEPARARAKLAKSKIDALIVDCDLDGTTNFLRELGTGMNTVPLVIVSSSVSVANGRTQLEDTGATFVFKKPISVEQAVRTLSAARNMILDGRLRYNRHALDLPVSLAYGSKKKVEAHLMNLSQGGVGIRLYRPLALPGPVRVSFQLPDGKVPMKLQGEVAWIDKMGNAGIRFLDMSPEVKRDLQLWLAQQYLTH